MEPLKIILTPDDLEIIKDRAIGRYVYNRNMGTMEAITTELLAFIAQQGGEAGFELKPKKD